MKIYNIGIKKYVVNSKFENNITKTFIEYFYEYFKIPKKLEKEISTNDAIPNEETATIQCSNILQTIS